MASCLMCGTVKWGNVKISEWCPSFYCLYYQHEYIYLYFTLSFSYAYFLGSFSDQQSFLIRTVVVTV